MKPDEISLAERAASRIASGCAFRVWLDTPGARLALMPVRRAVYLAYTAEGRLSYVGKVARHAGGVDERLREHFAKPGRRAAWRALWVVPLKPGTDDESIRALEESLIELLAPPGNIQHQVRERV